ncbi:hypothetical protein D3C71_1038670 [compost metagenome]
MITATCARPRAPQQARREPVVADHQTQGQRTDHHHAGRSAQPTKKREQRDALMARRERQRQRVHVRRYGVAEQRRTRPRERQDRQRDQHQIQREQPASGAYIRRIAALHHADVELMRQQEHRQPTQQHQRHEATGRCIHQRRRRRRRQAIQPKPDEQAQHQHRAQLEHRLHRHRQYQAAIVFGHIRTARAKQHRKQRHRQRHIQGAVVPRRAALAGIHRARGDHAEAHRHRLELQRDIRNQTQRRNQRDRCREPCVAAKASGDQIGQRRRIRFARQPHQSHHHAHGQRVEQDRPDKSRRQRPAVTRRLGDRAVERPRRAMHGQRKRIHMPPVPRERRRSALAIQRRTEHQGQPGKAGQRHGHQTQHAVTFPRGCSAGYGVSAV